MDRYEEALERAKAELSADITGGTRNVLLTIFPQLKESDDERIRKWLINTIKQIPDGSIEWETICKSDVLAWLDRPSEENPADKVEQEFKVGDWVVSPNGVYWHIDAILDGRYRVSSDSGYSADWPLDTNIYHKFTIQDAKDGDVIIYDDGWTCIFKHIHGIWYSSYCFITADGEFHTGYEQHAVDSTINGNAHPATKEQREQLEKAMAEAGYTFDFEKKELKKIKKNSAWSEEDEINYSYALAACKYYGEAKGYADTETHQKANNWLKSLKKRYTWKPNEEQIIALRWVLNNVPYCKHKEEISGLLDQIKDL